MRTEDGPHVDDFQTRTSFARKTLKRCKNNGEADNVVLIDVDTDGIDNVIILDVPESLKQKLQGASVLRKDRRSQFQNVIWIDDGDESSNFNQPATSVEEGADFSSDASSSCRFYPSSGQTRNSMDEAGDDCQFLQENLSPLKLSKCKRTYCGKASSRNCYGPGPEMDSDQSDSDHPDDEFMEGTSGKLHEQWEKANKKKKHGFCNDQSGKDDQPSTSTMQKVEVKNTTGHDLEDRFYPSNAEQTTENVKFSSCSFCCDGAHCCRGPSSCSCTEQVIKRTDHYIRFSKDKQKTLSAEHCSLNHEASIGLKYGSNKASFPCEEASFFQTQHSVDADVGNGTASCSSHIPNDYRSGCSSSVDKENMVNEELLFRNSKQGNTVPGESAGKGPPLSGKKDAGECFGDVMLEHQQQEQKDVTLHEEDGNVNTVQDCLINDREKLKETDEYKRAVKEEWASREQALRLQAEEAQKLRQLRKRKKAESLRLLDMERRQKQRVEEMRETQKKDEENMNLKEQLRAEVRKELCQLEIKCQDMASLLRGLGVHVAGGFFPLPNEIRAAYKRALLIFHPDRAPASDIRKLVEAEEKFKLISRMKEKFLSTS